MDWVDVAKAAPSCPFEYAPRLMEVILLGVVALRAGTKIHYDADSMRVTNALGAQTIILVNLSSRALLAGLRRFTYMPPLDHLFVLSIMPCVATWMGLPGRAFFLFASWKPFRSGDREMTGH